MTSLRKSLNPPTVWIVPEVFRDTYSHAVEISSPTRLLFISGQVGVKPNGALPFAFDEQAEVAMNNVEALLESSGMTAANLVKLTYLFTRAADAASLISLRRKRWGMQEPPASTAFTVVQLAKPEYLIQIEAVACYAKEAAERSALKRLINWPLRIVAGRRAMKHLAAMDDRELCDIGLCRQDLLDAMGRGLGGDPTGMLAERAKERHDGWVQASRLRM
jgi:enamine deaminase RidA (YjgF/YER057c/UK114 family)